MGASDDGMGIAGITPEEARLRAEGIDGHSRRVPLVDKLAAPPRPEVPSVPVICIGWPTIERLRVYGRVDLEDAHLIAADGLRDGAAPESPRPAAIVRAYNPVETHAFEDQDDAREFLGSLGDRHADAISTSGPYHWHPKSTADLDVEGEG